MEDLVLIQAISVVVSALSLLQGLSYFIRKVRRFLSSALLRKIANLTIIVVSLITVFVTLGALLFFSTKIVFFSLSPSIDVWLGGVIADFLLLFLFALYFVHLAGYCFSGVLHRCLPSVKWWPKSVDYIYYLAGAAVLILIIAQIHNRGIYVTAGLKWQILLGVYLFSLKIFKTSYEIFPKHVFRWEDGWIRDPIWGKVI